MKQGKLEALNNLWNSTYRKILLRGRKTKDAEMTALGLAIATINKDCKEWVLKKFIERCAEKHALAFFQWRVLERKRYVLLSDLQETLATT